MAAASKGTPLWSYSWGICAVWALAGLVNWVGGARGGVGVLVPTVVANTDDLPSSSLWPAGSPDTGTAAALMGLTLAALPGGPPAGIGDGACGIADAAATPSAAPAVDALDGPPVAAPAALLRFVQR